MRGITGMIVSATMSLMVFSSPVIGRESCKLGGLWRLISLDVENVTSEKRVRIYSEYPSRYMTVTCDGRFSAWAGNTQAGPVLSIWEDVGRWIAESTPLDDAIYYSGSYRLDGTKITFRSDKVHYEGPTIFDKFDLMWGERRAETEGVQNFQLTPKGSDSETLLIETAPMPNPNRAGNAGTTIVARALWERKFAPEIRH